MWFKAPKGVTGVTVEQQQFECSYPDKDGNLYVEVPDHFAAKMFEADFVVGSRPPDAPEGSTIQMRSVPADPNIVRDLQQQVGELQAANTALIEQLKQVSGLLASVTLDRDEALAEVERLTPTQTVSGTGKK